MDSEVDVVRTFSTQRSTPRKTLFNCLHQKPTEKLGELKDVFFNQSAVSFCGTFLGIHPSGWRCFVPNKEETLQSGRDIGAVAGLSGV
jgi:hypothetical protein